MTKTTLIPVFTGILHDQSVQLCNARDLHAYLQIGKDFSTWIKDRIAQYGFISGEDFVTAEILSSPKSGSSKARRQRLTDYHLTLDTAKELSMVENNEQGRMARRYFIEQEKIALALLTQTQPVAELAAPHNRHHITPAQADQLVALIHSIFQKNTERHNAWIRFKAYFKIHSYKRLPASKFDEAITFIESTDARRRNELGPEAFGCQGAFNALDNTGLQIDLDALSRQVAAHLMTGQHEQTAAVGDEGLNEIETLLSSMISEFNFVPNNIIFRNLHAVRNLVKKLRSNKGSAQGVRCLPAAKLGGFKNQPQQLMFSSSFSEFHV